MAEQSKTLLIAQIDAARENMLLSATQLRQDLDVPKHFKSAFDNHKSAWIGGAAIMGWVLARLPGRRTQKRLAQNSHQHNGHVAPHQGVARKYAISGILLGILRFALTALKPALTAVASRKIKDMAAQRIRW